MTAVLLVLIGVGVSVAAFFAGLYNDKVKKLKNELINKIKKKIKRGKVNQEPNNDGAHKGTSSQGGGKKTKSGAAE